MNGFKIVGLRIKEECNPYIRKALKPNIFYRLNNNYQIGFKDDNELLEIISITPSKKKCYDFYSSNDLSVNISAIVGRNGSGKSTLLELIYIASFLLGEKYGHIGDLEWKDRESNPQNYISDYQERIANDLLGLKHRALFEIYYINDTNVVYRLTNNGYDEIEVQTLFEGKWSKINSESLDKIFYSICINYSLYGLNELDSPWLGSLFHKNDGYKTPLVINPYRRDGNINVNNELHLSQTRTMLNLANSDEETPEIVNGKFLSEVRFVIDVVENQQIANSQGIQFEFRNVLEEHSRKHNQSILELFSIISNFLCNYQLTSKDLQELINEQELDSTVELVSKFDLFKEEPPRFLRVKYEMIKYAIRKLFKICVQYPKEYGGFLVEPKDRLKSFPIINDLEGLILKLSQDKSHITLKLRQIIYSIAAGYFETKSWKKIPYYKDPKKVSFALDMKWSKVGKMINDAEKNFMKDLEERMEVIPAALVKPVLLVRSKDNDEDHSFSVLSSGEQQLANTIQTVVYHLYNLNSVHHSSDNNRLKYENINIIFDEVELYFHPDFQRAFISELLRAIKGIKHDKLKSLNIIFSTHSPFILSDIPASCVLRLEDGMPQPESSQTFGSNIHELLAHDFFLKFGFMGEFAKQTINKTVHYLTYHINQLEINRIEKEANEHNGFELPIYMKLKKEALISENEHIETMSINLSNELKLEHYDIINLIGERVLQRKLLEMFDIAFNKK